MRGKNSRLRIARFAKHVVCRSRLVKCPRAVLSGFVVAALLTAVVPAMAQKGESYFGERIHCKNAVSRKLAESGIKMSDIERVLSQENWSEEAQGGGSQVFQGWTLWMQPKTCDGRIVVDLTSECSIETIYTAGNCEFKGIEHQ